MFNACLFYILHIFIQLIVKLLTINICKEDIILQYAQCRNDIRITKTGIRKFLHYSD